MKDRAAAAAFHRAFRTLRDQPAPGAALAVVPGVRRTPSFGTVAAKPIMSAVAGGETVNRKALTPTIGSVASVRNRSVHC